MLQLALRRETLLYSGSPVIDDINRRILESMGVSGDSEPAVPAGPEVVEGIPPVASCGICGDTLEGAESAGPTSSCGSCESRYHQDCWEYNEGCAVYGCKGALSTALVSLENSLSPPTETPSPAIAPRQSGITATEESAMRIFWRRLAATTPGNLRLTAMLFLVMVQFPFARAVQPLVRMVLQIRILWYFSFLVWAFLTFIPMMVLAMIFMGAEGILAEASRRLRAGTRLKLTSLGDTPTKDLEARISDQPRNPALHEALGLVYFARRDWGRARDVFQRLLEIEPSHTGALFRMAKIEEQDGDPTKVVALLQKVARQHHRKPFVDAAKKRLDAMGEPLA